MEPSDSKSAAATLLIVFAAIWVLVAAILVIYDCVRVSRKAEKLRLENHISQLTMQRNDALADCERMLKERDEARGQLEQLQKTLVKIVSGEIV
jgi:hypothetical protein